MATNTRKRIRESDGDANPERSSTVPKKGKTNKKLSKREREEIARSLKQINLVVLSDEVTSQLKLQYSERSLNRLVDLLCANEELLKEMLEWYRSMFVQLYLDTGKKKDPFLKFVIKWNHHCSVMLLEELYGVTEIDLDQQLSKSVKVLRTKWLDFCKSSGFPVPVSNPVTITLSFTVYNTLITRINVKGEESETPIESTSLDGDDVYYRFGGAALCEMLHLRYEQIKTAPFNRKDSISQEITILQAINSKDKSAIPNYLQYRDLGFMYFPHPTFIPLLRHIDTTLKEVVNPLGMEKYGSSLIKTAHKKVNSNTDHRKEYLTLLQCHLPDTIDLLSTESVNNVFVELTRKVCNIRIQEFISSTKQNIAANKGLATSIEQNVRASLLTHHTQLSTKLTNSHSK